MIGAIAAILAARLAAGVLLAGGIIRARHPTPPAFGRFLVDGAAGLLAVSLLLGWGRPEFPWWAGLFGLTAGLALAHRRPASSPRLLAFATLGAGLAGALGPALPRAVEAALNPVLAVASGFSAAGLLGATAAAMVLGHWYLVDTTLSVRPLALGASLLIGSAALRTAVVGAALAAGGAAALGVSSPSDLIYSTPALFFSFRALTGLISLAAVALLVRATVRIRSTQSATGLLYVALILALFGELTAAFLEEVTSGALT